MNESVIRRSWDLIIIVVLSLLLAWFIYLIPDNPARIILGLPFILFFPGYALIATLFPEKKPLDLIERIALSFGLSIAVVPLIGFGLNFTPFGIRLEPILWSLILFNVAFSLLGLWRRDRSAEPFLPFQPKALWSSTMLQYAKESKVDRVLTIVLVLAMISSVGALAYVVAAPRGGEQFSEFYILGPGGQASGYPNNLTIGENGEIIVGIANHEGRTINYTIEVWLVNATFTDNTTTVNHMYYFNSINVTLDNTPAMTQGSWLPQWQTPYNFSVPYSGEYKLWFILLKDEQRYSGPSLTDMVGTDAATRFANFINDNSSNTLNLNLKVA